MKFFSPLFLISKEGEILTSSVIRGMSTAPYTFWTVEHRSTSVRYCQNFCPQKYSTPSSL